MSGESARSRTCAAGGGIQNLQENHFLFITLSKRGQPPWLLKQGQTSPEVKNRCISCATKMINFLKLFEQECSLALCRTTSDPETHFSFGIFGIQ